MKKKIDINKDKPKKEKKKPVYKVKGFTLTFLKAYLMICLEEHVILNLKKKNYDLLT